MVRKREGKDGERERESVTEINETGRDIEICYLTWSCLSSYFRCVQSRGS